MEYKVIRRLAPEDEEHRVLQGEPFDLAIEAELNGWGKAGWRLHTIDRRGSEVVLILEYGE